MSLARYLSKLGALLSSDGKVTQAALAANVAGNGPAFSVARSGTQTVSAGTWTKVQLNYEEFDTAGAFDSSTNYRFQPTVAGYYFVQGTVTCLTSSFTACLAAIHKNGSAIKKGLNYGATNVLDDWNCTISSLVYMNGTTDYLELYGFSIGNAVNEFTSGSEFTFFSGFLARAA